MERRYCYPAGYYMRKFSSKSEFFFMNFLVRQCTNTFTSVIKFFAYLSVNLQLVNAINVSDPQNRRTQVTYTNFFLPQRHTNIHKDFNDRRSLSSSSLLSSSIFLSFLLFVFFCFSRRDEQHICACVRKKAAPHFRFVVSLELPANSKEQTKTREEAPFPLFFFLTRSLLIFRGRLVGPTIGRLADA